MEAARHEPVLRQLIAERRDPFYAGEKDLIWRLLQARDRETGKALHDDEMCDELLTLANTAVTPLRVLSWVWYLLALHPAAEAKLHAELAEVLGGRAPDFADLDRLPYLRRVIDETMRLYPPLPVMLVRGAAADDNTLCGRHIPKGAIITIAPWIIHRHQKLWIEPTASIPTASWPKIPPAVRALPIFPFSIGPHICTGLPLSMMEILVAVAILAQRFRFRLKPGHVIEPLGWLSLRPAGGICAGGAAAEFQGMTCRE